jgi:flagellar protein FlaG
MNPSNPSSPSHPQPRIQVTQTSDYCETYANSVQVRVSVWDFLLVFGKVHQDTPEEVAIENNLAVYLSPQQAKALWNVLGQNLAQYEQTFGKLALEPQVVPQGPVH